MVEQKVEQANTLIIQASAAVAMAPFLTMGWWNSNSDGIIAMCAAVGAVVSVTTFLIGAVKRRKNR